MNPARLGIVAAVVGAVAYGINIPAARLAGIYGVSGPNLIAIRCLLLVAVLALLMPLFRVPLHVAHGQRRRMLALGLLCAGTALCYLTALNFVPVAVAVTLFYTFPLWLILAAPLAGTGRLTARKIGVFGAAFAGILMCVGPAFGGLDWRGIAFALAASVFCAGIFQLTPQVKAERMTVIFWSQLAVLCVSIPWVMVTGVATPSALSAAAFLVAASSIGFYIGFGLQVVSTRLIPPATAGLIFLIEPIVAISVAAVALGETLAALQWAGIALVLGVLAADLWFAERPANEGR
jgi:drug/metabolite transporter (DMT)-like permease